MGFLKKVGRALGKVAGVAVPLVTGTTPAALLRTFLNKKLSPIIGAGSAKIRSKLLGPYVKGKNEGVEDASVQDAPMNPTRSRAERTGGLTTTRLKKKGVRASAEPASASSERDSAPVIGNI